MHAGLPLKAFIMVQGIIGNSLVITVTCTNSKLHTIANYLILNLAVSDMLMVCIDMPISLYALSTGKWTFGVVVCYFQSFTIFWFGIVCLFTLAIISLNRYYYICRFSSYSKVFNHNTVKMIITIVWILSAIMSALCLVPQWSNVEYLPGPSSCMPNFQSSSVIFSIILLVIAILIPNCIMLGSYLMIFLTVRKSKRNVNNFKMFETAKTNAQANRAPTRASNRAPTLNRTVNNTQSWVSAFTQVMEKRRANRQKEELKLTRTLFIVFFVYNICWMPLVVTSMLQIFGRDVWREALLASAICMYVSSAINPYIYGVGNRQYRDAIRSTFQCKKSEQLTTVTDFTERRGQIAKWWGLIDRLQNRSTDSSGTDTTGERMKAEFIESNLANALRLIARGNVQFLTESQCNMERPTAQMEQSEV